MQVQQSRAPTNSMRDRVTRMRNSVSKRRMRISPTAATSCTGRIRKIYESTREAQIKNHSKGTEDCNSAQAPDEQESKERVQNREPGKAFYGSDVGADVHAMVVQCSDEVGEDSEDDCCAAELDEAEEEGD